MSDAILVLGMHRSGTSATAGVLTLLGGEAPKHSMGPDASNRRGSFQSKLLTEFNDELIASAGSRWNDWRQFNRDWYGSPTAARFKQTAWNLFASEFEGATLPVFKDPRICRIAPFWLDVLRNSGVTPHVVMPIRSPLEVTQSLNVGGNSADRPTTATGLLLWLRHVVDAEFHTRSLPRCIFNWRDLLTDWRSVCGKISTEAQIGWPRMSDRAAYEVDRFLSRELVHHTCEPTGDTEVHEWVRRAYEALMELSRNPLSDSTLTILDEIRDALDQSGRIFGRILIEGEIELETTSGRISALTGEVDALKARETALSAEKATEIAELAERARRAEGERAEVIRNNEILSKTLAEIREAWALLDVEMQTVTREKAALSKEVTSLRSERVRLEAELHVRRRESAERTELAAQVERAEARAAEAARSNETLSKTLEEVRAELAALVGSNRQELSELAVRAEEAENEAQAAARDKAALSAELATLRDERDALGKECARAAGELESQRKDLAKKTLALASLAGRAEQAAAREAARSRAEMEKVLAANDKAHAERLLTLRHDLVDAQAELGHWRAMNDGMLVRLTPRSIVRRRVAKALLDTGLFDVGYYLQRYPDAVPGATPDDRGVGLAAATHYAEEGFCRGYFPNPFFDTRWYIDRYEDVRRAGINPLLHYYRYGVTDGRDPGPEFQTMYYVEANPDVRESGYCPLAHYLHHGRHEGRRPMRAK